MKKSRGTRSSNKRAEGSSALPDSPDSPDSSAPLYPRIYGLVRRIPRGKVTSYGDIARRLGVANGARQVGYALHALPSGTAVPWQRVLNSAGKVSLPPGSHSAITQRLKLEAEGVGFRVDGSVGESYWWGKGKGEKGKGKAKGKRRAKKGKSTRRKGPKRMR